MDGVPGDDRHHHVQLELPGLGRGEYRRVAAVHLIADLVHHLGNGGIHLAGHDRRTRLHGGEADLGESRPWSHAEQPQVGSDLRDLDCEATERA